MKKVYVRLVGGLGNQMFIYAFGLALSNDRSSQLVVDNISGFGSLGDEYKSEFALCSYNIKSELISNRFSKYFIANRFFWYVVKTFNISHTEKYSTAYAYRNIDNVNSIFYEGYWQSHMYFDKYKPLLKEKFDFKDKYNLSISSYKSKILSSKNSVAIGMRFYEETPSTSSYYTVMNDDYYDRAIKILEKEIDRPVYFIFSTNIIRAKKILSKYTSKDIVFINPVMSKKGASLDLYLMSLCNNFIISNGTFYWWAAYLGEKKESIVIAPEKGFPNLDTLPIHWHKL